MLKVTSYGIRGYWGKLPLLIAKKLMSSHWATDGSYIVVQKDKDVDNGIIEYTLMIYGMDDIDIIFKHDTFRFSNLNFRNTIYQIFGEYKFEKFLRSKNRKDSIIDLLDEHFKND
jgi:hypothetical protein